MTTAERLTRLETIIELGFHRIDKKLDNIEEVQCADVADLAAIKNRGVGLLVGVGLAGGALGATLAKYAEKIL